MKKKIITPILLIVFSFFFLINPNQIKGASSCGESCTKTSDCGSGSINNIACPHCWPPGYNPNNVVYNKDTAEAICAQAGSNCTCAATPVQTTTNNTNMCNKSCISDSECANDTNGCTVCWQTSYGSGAGGCESGVCTCINPADKNDSEWDRAKKKWAPPTAFTSLTAKTNSIVTASMGIAGGVAFILIIIGAFQIILSAGSPDRVKAGKEMITAALAGLFLIIFSVFILKLIGADILQIPGFE